MIGAARPSCFFHGFTLSKFFPWERYGFESCAFNSEVKKKKKKNPSDFFEHDRDTVGREDNPQQDKQNAVSHFKIQHNQIGGGRRSDVSDSPPVGETRAPTPSVLEDPSAGIQICEPDQLKSFPPGPQPGVKTQSLSSLRVLVLEASACPASLFLTQLEHIMCTSVCVCVCLKE